MTNMNSNAVLYKQHLYYNRHEAPYQCLTLPWWVRTSRPVYWPRHGCIIEPLNCGEVVFRRIAQDIRRARKSVDIITWGFDPGMVLERSGYAEEGERYGDLLKKVASDSNKTVRLLIWHDDIASQWKMKNIPGYYGGRFSSLGSGSTSYYSEAHRKYNAEWFEQVRSGKIPNLKLRVRDVPAAVREPCLRGEEVPSGLSAYVAKLYAAHHQKMVLIDYESPPHAVGYVMGHNSTTDFWDTVEHLFRDPRRERLYSSDPIQTQAQAWEQGPAINPSSSGYRMTEHEIAMKERAVQAYLDSHSRTAKPYQDVSCRLRGPVVADINHNFCQGWLESTEPGDVLFDCMRIVARAQATSLPQAVFNRIVKTNPSHSDKKFVEDRKKIAHARFQVGGQHSVQLLRTQPMHEEKTIKECYANLARQMHHYIFIQNQYVQYETWAEYLHECIHRQRANGYLSPIYVFVLTSTPEIAGMDLPTYDVASHLGQSELIVQEHAEAERKGTPLITPSDLAKFGLKVLMGSLWTCARSNLGERLSEADYEEIYIHSKVAIVDDAAFTIGSANLNLRSMALDSELNILSEAKDVAYDLRSQLFLQSTGTPGPGQFGDMGEEFSKWNKLMERNWNAKVKGKPLSSLLMRFHVDREPGSPVI